MEISRNMWRGRSRVLRLNDHTTTIATRVRTSLTEQFGKPLEENARDPRYQVLDMSPSTTKVAGTSNQRKKRMNAQACDQLLVNNSDHRGLIATDGVAVSGDPV
jgi:hypothetical protein